MSLWSRNRNYNPFPPPLPPLSICYIVPLKKVNESILKKHDKLITKTLLYVNDKLDLSCNKSI